MEGLAIKTSEVRKESSMPEGLSFVFVSLQRINTDRESTSTSIARELSKYYKVLYINPPIDRKTLLSHRNDKYVTGHIEEIRHKKRNLSKIGDNLWMYNPHSIMESINWVPSTRIFSLLNRINNKRFADEISHALGQLGMEKFILINDKDMFRSFHLKELLNPRFYVYLYRDYTLAYDYWKRHGTSFEPRLISKADAVLCNSHGFRQLTQQFNPQSFFIGNGCNTNLFNGFNDWKMPEDLGKIGKPLIGYCGALTRRRLNIELLIKIAESRPQWNIVLIGTECEHFKRSALHQLPNVHFLGQKNTRELPGYIYHFDVCINPQLVNDLTNDNYPLKIDEYLAMGKPVVATATKTMKEIFYSHTYLCETYDCYLENIERALSEDNSVLQEDRIQFARSHSWENVTKEFIHALVKIGAD